MGKKVALVTGGATGIGKQTLQHLAAAQCDLVFTYVKSKEKSHLLCEQLEKQYGVKADCFPCDVSDLSSCERLMQEIALVHGGIDIYVHNAGPYIHERKTMMEYTLDNWQYIMNGNLNSFFYITKHILPYMRKERWGRIITLGFDRSDTAPGWIYRSAFAAAKSGLTSLTRTLALEEASSGITVNMVCPGDITGQWKEATIEDAIAETESRVPVGRPGTGEDIARVIAFLSDDKSSFITGSVIPVTGGVDVLGKVFRNQKNASE